jgi:hypothetical protein
MSLWAGADLKLEYAGFHYFEMCRAVGRTSLPLYAHFNAFLSAARSIPEIIQCCFGVDRGHKVMETWFDGLNPTEQDQRRLFKSRFAKAYKHFRDDLPLSNTRHVIEHRSGVAPVEVVVISHLGVTYVGTPAEPIPTTEFRPVADSSIPRDNAIPMPEPLWTDYKIDGQPLFSVVRDYLANAGILIAEARAIAACVYGSGLEPTPPPT